MVISQEAHSARIYWHWSLSTKIDPKELLKISTLLNYFRQNLEKSSLTVVHMSMTSRIALD